RLQTADVRRDAARDYGDWERRATERQLPQLRYPRVFRLHEDGLRALASYQASGDKIHALNQKRVMTAAKLVLLERRRPFDEGVLRAGYRLAVNPMRRALPRR
ncbi:MAG: hypothetical protein GX537_06035, partial [Actinobacteria bacterium]|nr:hypothetical protein [Actinomycetota bacterium]